MLQTEKLNILLKYFGINLSILKTNLNTEKLDVLIEHLKGNLKELKTNLETEKLDKIITLLGGNIHVLKTNLISEKYGLIIELLGGSRKNNATIDDLLNYLAEKTAAVITGEYITVNDSLNMPCKISIDTNIKQDSREGYNLFNVEDVLEGHYVGANGETVASEYTNVSGYIKVKANVTYTLKYDYSSLSNTGDRRRNFYDLDKNLLESTPTSASIKSRTFTPTQDGYVRFAYDKNCYNVMVYEGTDDKPYEQYGSMPSIEFPSEIQTPVGKQSVVVGNKNWFDISKFIQGNWGNAYTSTRVTAWFKKVKANEKTTVKKYNSILGFSVGITENTKQSEKNNKLVNESGWVTADSYTLTAKRDGYLFLQVRYADNTTAITPSTLKETDFQVEIGDTATDYTPHQSQIQDLDLTEKLLGKIYKKDGKWFKNIKYIEMLLNEKSTITYFVEQGDYILFQIPAYNVLSKIYCDKLKYKINWGTNYNYESVTKGGSTVTENKLIQIKILSSRLTEISANGILQWLGENNLKVICELATPIEKEITDETLISQLNAIDKMHTYEGVTNLYTINDNGISPVLNLEYKKAFM